MTDYASVARVKYAKYRYDTRGQDKDQFSATRYDPAAYVKQRLGWTPWASGDPSRPGQQEILDAYVLAMRQQHEKYEYDNGRLKPSELVYWRPGDIIQYYLSVDAGHGVGKTKVASALVNHCLDHFQPSIIYTIAPTGTQLKNLLWKEIIVDRKGKGLPGRLLEGTLRIHVAANHFVDATSTNDQGGQGTERLQGQHNDYVMFLIDEAEAIPQYVFDAIRSMTSGGIASMVVVLRNPRTTTCPAHLIRAFPHAHAMTISCLSHPNVTSGRDIVPNSVTRKYIEEMLEFAETVPAHDPDHYTFELDWRPGVIYKPKKQFLWRVMGIAHHDGTIDTFAPYGRFDAAVARQFNSMSQPETPWLQVGVDVARYGDDVGTVYFCYGGRAWLVSEISGQDTNVYRRIIREEAIKLKATAGSPIINFSLRVDGGGGYSSGIIDPFRQEPTFRHLWAEYELLEVHNNGTPADGTRYYDRVTEMYADAAEWLRVGQVSAPPHALQMLKSDLCDRFYKFDSKVVDGDKVDVKRLVGKIDFRRHRQKQSGDPRSPDHGDGFCLAVSRRSMFTDSEELAGGWAFAR